MKISLIENLTSMINREKLESEILCPECGKPLIECAKEYGSKEEMIEDLANTYTDSVFEDFWRERKDTLKQLSKKEVAEEAFFESVAVFLHNFIPDKPPENTVSSGSTGND